MAEDDWWMVEAGWWLHDDYHAGICVEHDGKWHVYVGDHDTPGNSAHAARTLKDAKKWMKRYAKRKGL